MNLRRECAEFYFHCRQKLFARIPTVSGWAALLVAGWVASTFTTNWWRSFGARTGLHLFHGPRHYVHKGTYVLLIFVLPALAAATAAYVVQRLLYRRRAQRLLHDIAVVVRLKPEIQEDVGRRNALLDEALRLGLLTEAEHATKRADLYAQYARDGGHPLARLVASKLT